MTSLAQAITEMIQKALPAPVVRVGTVAFIRVPGVDPVTGDDIRGRVVVTDLDETGAALNLACDWTAAFDLEIAAMAEAMIGRQVEVHFVHGQPIVANSIILGDKS